MARIAGKTSSGKRQSSNNQTESLLKMLKTQNEKIESPEQKEVKVNIENNSENIENHTNTNQISYPDLVELFGGGFSEKECRQMYKRYITLQDNYPLRTKMHEEALITYVKYAFKRDKAIADDDIEAVDKWGKLAAKQAQDAKINPSQLSAADLSDGMTSFSQLSATVEKNQDIIPLLPQFIEEPKDRVDYTLWEYVNYIRHLDGKPLIEYKQLYQFLSARYESLKKRYKFMKKEDDGNFDENDLDSEV